MKDLFEKHETLFCILLIVIYVVANSFCRQNYGFTDYRTLIANILISILLIALMIILKRTKYYGMTGIKDFKPFLYFIPLVIISSVNLWSGIITNYTGNEILLYVLIMVNIGFIEEVIFRGFLFKMMAKDNIKTAIIVSAITFGIGHIVNLLNGADFIPTLVQIIYAIALGYMFVIIFYKSGSLIPCILSHIAINALGIFNIENSITMYLCPIALFVLPICYAIYINKKTPDNKVEA